MKWSASFSEMDLLNPSLLCKLWPESSRDMNGQEALNRALDSIKQLQAEQEIEERAQKSTNIEKWKCKMAQGTFPWT